MINKCDLLDLKNEIVNKYLFPVVIPYETNNEVYVITNHTMSASIVLKVKIGIFDSSYLIRGMGLVGGFTVNDYIGNPNAKLYFVLNNEVIEIPRNTKIYYMPGYKCICFYGVNIFFRDLHDYFEASTYIKSIECGYVGIDCFLESQLELYWHNGPLGDKYYHYGYNKMFPPLLSMSDPDDIKIVANHNYISEQIFDITGYQIDISEISLAELLANQNFELSDDARFEVFLGIHNGVSEEDVKSYILEDTVEKMREKRLLLEANLSEQEKINDNSENNEDIENDDESYEDIMNYLDSRIGLTKIKKEVRELSNIAQMQAKRKEQKLPYMPFSLHMVFTGNPGTGKTTIARIIAKLYKKIGILSKGHLVEVDRSGLIGQYIGHTEEKTQEIIKSAMGGVLFIDEAYTLVKEGTSNDFGQNAIDTILKAMEDYRDDFVVIVAGYEKPMRAFINSNQGLKSRFNKYIDFPDYTVEEMEKIFYLECEKYKITITDAARTALINKLEYMSVNKDESFANGRDVRNLFEKIMTRLASRISSTGENLTVIVEDDIIGL